MNQVTFEGGRSSPGYMNLAYLQAGSLNHLRAGNRCRYARRKRDSMAHMHASSQVNRGGNRRGKGEGTGRKPK